MKIKRKGLITVAVALLMITVIVQVYSLGEQSSNMQQKREQDCEPECPATRAYGEDSPVQAQEEKPEEQSEENIEEAETPVQEQTQTQEQLRNCDCDNEDSEQYQYQYQYQNRYGQGED